MFYARSIETSHYYPFGTKHRAKTSLSPDTITEPAPPNQNQQKAQEARDRIRQAVTDWLAKNALPTPVTARRQAIKAYGIGNLTLDKYNELWHPNYLNPLPEEQYHTLAATPTISDLLNPLPEGQYHTMKDNKLVTIAAISQGQAVRSLEVGGCGGFSTGAPISDHKSERAEQQLAKMQAWLASDDPILVAEAQQVLTAQVQAVGGGLGSLEAVTRGQRAGFANKEAGMAGGFGQSQPQRRSGKTALKEIRQLGVVSQRPAAEAPVDLAMQAEVEAFFAQYQQEHPEELALAWSAGVYNPLAQVDLLAVGARFLQAEEEDWLGLSRLVGLLLVEDELDAIYFTAPPPEFALAQADWYVRSDLTTFLEEPLLLREAVQQYPLTDTSIRGAIDQRVQQLGWTLEQRSRFVLELFERPEAALTQADWELLLFELQSRLQDADSCG